MIGTTLLATSLFFTNSHAETPQKPKRSPYMISKLNNIEYAYGVYFLGWSTNGRYYALKHISMDEGAGDCPHDVTLEIVDAETDKWAKGSGFQLYNKYQTKGYKEDDWMKMDVPCEYPKVDDLVKAFDTQSAPLLKVWDIQVGNYIDPLPLSVSKTPNTYTFSDGKYSVYFESEADQERAWDEGNGYFLHWVKPSVVKVEKGKRRDNVYGYSLHSVFPSPNGKHYAFIIQKTQDAHEGMAYTYMTNGTKLPEQP